MLFKHQSLWESTRFLRVRWPLEEAQFLGLSGGVISQHQTFPTSLWLKSFWKASMITDYAIKLFAHTYSCSLKLIRIMKDSWVTQTQLHRRWDKQIPTWPPADNSAGRGWGRGTLLALPSLWGWIFWNKEPIQHQRPTRSAPVGMRACVAHWPQQTTASCQHTRADTCSKPQQTP